MEQAESQTDNEWDGYADTWDADEGARTYAAAAFASLDALLRDGGRALAGAEVLDFGCGTGLLTERMIPEGANVTAVDTSTAMLDVLNSKAKHHGWTSLRTTMDLSDTGASFDLIVCSSVCGFLDDYAATATQLAGLLRPGGLFVQWDWERDDNDDDPYGLSCDEITSALDAAGLDEVWVGTGFELEFGSETMRPLMGHGKRPASDGRT